MNHQKHHPQDLLHFYDCLCIYWLFYFSFTFSLLLSKKKPKQQIYMALDELVVCYLYFIYDLEFSIGGHIKVYECKRIMYTVI